MICPAVLAIVKDDVGEEKKFGDGIWRPWVAFISRAGRTRDRTSIALGVLSITEGLQTSYRT